jgi:RNA polymerase sigma-70 factor (ECF subfamily)
MNGLAVVQHFRLPLRKSPWMQTSPGLSRELPAARLAERLRAREPSALAEWYGEEHPQVFRLCLAFLANYADAEDLAQDAMLHLADHLEQWDPKRPYLPWRSRVVMNLARDWRRRAAAGARPTVSAPELPSRLPAPDAAAEQAEIRQSVQAVLGALPEREREAFVLHDLQGLNVDETAEAMEIGNSSVRSLLTLARRRLRTLLTPRLQPAEGGGARNV